MTPELGLVIAQLLLKYGPSLTEEIVTLIHKESVTLDDWKSLFAKVKKYEDYAPSIPPA